MDQELERLMALVDEGRDDEADKWARPRAEAGDANAQFLLGYLVFGSGAVDFRSACDWLHRAAEQGHAEALYELSRIDESIGKANTGLPNSDEKRAMLRRAAELGSVRAQRELGCYLAVGADGFVQDESEGRLWYGRAAAAGHVDAQCNLGLMYLLGEGGPAMPREGVAWLEQAAAGDPSEPMVPCAVEVLLGLYERGDRGVPVNPTRASAMRVRLEEVRKQRGG